MFSFEATIDGDEKVFHWIGKFPPKTDSNQAFNRAARLEETEISFYSGFVPALKEFVSGCFFSLKICSKLKVIPPTGSLGPILIESVQRGVCKRRLFLQHSARVIFSLPLGIGL